MTLSSLTHERLPQTKDRRRYDHVYAIVRIDEFLGSDTPTEHRITVKKVVPDADEAEREVERLNRLQGGKGVLYFSQVTRIKHEDESLKDAAWTSRVSALIPDPTTDAPAPEKRAWLETIVVPDYVQFPPPKGLGFPALRVYEVCSNPTEQHDITWKYMHVSIYTRRTADYVDVVGIKEIEGSPTASFAFRVFPDLYPTPLNELAPLDIVKIMAHRFGVKMTVGTAKNKFFLEREFPISEVVAPGAYEGEIINIDKSASQSCISSFTLSINPPSVWVALAFSIDTSKYGEWIKNR